MKVELLGCLWLDVRTRAAVMPGLRSGGSHAVVQAHLRLAHVALLEAGGEQHGLGGALVLGLRDAAAVLVQA